MVAKGVKKDVEENLKMRQFKYTWCTGNSLDNRQKAVRSVEQHLYSITQIKTALSADNDKVFI